MSLREAIRLSNVPIYQELARRVGLAPMGEQVARLDYGNRDIGTCVDRFWLDGPLQISAMEQVRFRPPGGGPRPSRGGPGGGGHHLPGAGARLDIARGKTGWWNAPARVSAGGWAGWTGRAVSSPLP